MNFKKILVASGATVLAAAAVFANRPSSVLATVFYTVNGTACHSFSTSTNSNFTTSASGTQATIRTGGGGVSKMYKSCSVSGGVVTVGNAVHFKVI